MTLGEVAVEVTADMTGFRKQVEGGVDDSVAKSKKQFEALGNAGKSIENAGQKMTRSLTLPIAAAGTAVVMTAASFDKSMNNVAAITGATGDQFDDMRQQAIDLGASTAFSASEAADGMKFLGQAGFDTNEIMAAMPGTLDLAAASATDLGQTADIMSNILTGFGESADQSTRYADVLAKTVSSSNTDMLQLGDAMKYVAPVAASAGYSMEQTAAAVGNLSNAGIQGCYDGETDVLVRRDGVPRWVSWADARDSDEYATVNPITQGIEWQRATRMIRYRHTGQMYRVRNRNVDLMVTPDHRMWVQPRADTDRSGQRVGGDTTDGTVGGYRDMRAHEVVGLPVRYLTGGLDWVGESPETVTIDGFDQWRGSWWNRVDKVEVDAEVWAAFLGWYVTEGSCRHGREGYQTRITQNPGPVRDRMRTTLTRLPWTVHEDANGFIIGGEQCYRQVADLGKAPEKHLPEYVFDWGADLLQMVMDTLVEGDGDQNGAVYTTSPRLRDDAQTLALLLGYSTTMLDQQQPGDTTTMPDGRTVTARHAGWKVNVRRRQHRPWHDPYRNQGVHGARQRPEANRATASDGFTGDGWVEYDDDVYCAEVPNSLLLVRRAGKVVVSGNSMAGTTLRGAISRLLDPSKKAATAMDDLGVNALDAEGNLKPMDDIVQQLADSGAKTADYMTIFGQRAGPGMAALVDQGADSLKGMEDELNSAGGTAEKMADTQLRGAAGALEELQGAAETLAIAIADSGLIDWFTEGVEGATKFVNVLSDLDPVVLKTGTAIAGVVAAMGPLLTVTGSVMRNFATVSAGLSTFRTKLTGVGDTTRTTGTRFTGLKTTMGEFRDAVARTETTTRTLPNAVTTVSTRTRTMGERFTAAGTAARNGMSRASTAMKNMSGQAKMLAGAAGIGALGAAFSSAKSKGTTFGNVMTGTVGGALTGLAVGGPVGLLVGALAGGGGTALVGAFKKAQDASRNLDAELQSTSGAATAKGVYDSLVASLDDVTGAYTNASRAAVVSGLRDPKTGELQAWVQTVKDAGVPLRTITSAMMGQQGAINQVNGVLRANTAEYRANENQIAENNAKIQELSQQQVDSSGEIDQSVTREIQALKDRNKELGASNETLKANSKAITDNLGVSDRAIAQKREDADATKSLSERMLMSKEATDALMKDWGQPVRKQLEVDVPDNMTEVTNIARQIEDLDRKDIEILLKSAGMKPTAENIQAVRRAMNQTMNMSTQFSSKMAQDLGVSEEAVNGLVRAMPQNLRIAFQSDPSKTLSDLKSVKTAAQQMQNPSVKNVKMMMEVAGVEPSVANIRKVRNSLRDAGKTTPNLDRWLTGIRKGTNKGADAARQGAKRTNENLRRSGRARADTSRYEESIKKGTNRAANAAQKGGQKVRENAQRPPSKAKANMGGLLGSVSKWMTRSEKAAQKGGKGVARGAEKGAKGAKANMNPFLSSVIKGMSKAERAGSKGGQNVGKNATKGTKAAKANMSPFLSSVVKAMTQAEGKAKTGGQKVGKNAEAGTKSAKADLSGFRSSITTGLNSAESSARSGGSSVGSAISNGAESGVRAAAGGVASAAATMVSNAIAAAKRAAKSKSPSRVTYQLGLDIDKGLEIGINTGAKGATRAGAQVAASVLTAMVAGTSELEKYFSRVGDKIQWELDTTNNAIEASEKKRGNAIDATEKKRESDSTRRLNKRLKQINKNKKLSDKAEKRLENRAKKADKRRQADAASDAKAARKRLATSIKNQRAQAAATNKAQRAALASAQKYYTAQTNKLQSYMSKLSQLRSDRESMISEVSSHYFSGAGEALSNTGGSFEVVQQRMSSLKSKLKKVSTLTSKALKAGIPQGMVQSILALGPDEAITSFNAILSGSKAQQKALAADYAAIQSTATNIGTQLGNKFYNTGIAAQEGLIKGLLNQKGLVSGANELARQLTAKVKKALGIKSPSVMMEKQVGLPSGEGVLLGMEKAIQTGVKKVSVTPIPPNLVSGTTGRSAPPAPGPPAPVTATVPAGAPATVINQNFYGPTTSGGRKAELDWTVRYSTNARRARWEGVAR